MRSIAICDRNRDDRFIMHTALKREFQEKDEKIKVVEYNIGEALVADLEERYAQFDLIILGIDEGRNGLETAGRIRELEMQVPVLFISASPDYAIEAYEVEAFGYLLKPLNESKLRIFVNRLIAQAERPCRTLKCKGGGVRSFFLDEIMWLESDRHDVRFHFVGGVCISATEKLGEVEALLEDERFLRCHQSYIINMDYVAFARTNFIMEDGASILIRVRSRKDILNQYYDYYEKKMRPRRRISNDF